MGDKDKDEACLCRKALLEGYDEQSGRLWAPGSSQAERLRDHERDQADQV